MSFLFAPKPPTKAKRSTFGGGTASSRKNSPFSPFSPKANDHQNKTTRVIRKDRLLSGYCLSASRDIYFKVTSDVFAIICSYFNMSMDYPKYITHRRTSQGLYKLRHNYIIHKTPGSDKRNKRLRHEKSKSLDSPGYQESLEKQRTYKVLLLGAGEVGKATLFKQLRHLYGRQFDLSERLASKTHLAQNVIEAMRTLAIYSNLLSDRDAACAVDPKIEEVRARVARMSDKARFTRKDCSDFLQLWNDEGIRKTADYRSQFQLVDTYQHLFDRMHHYHMDSFIPTMEDVLCSRQRTTGVNKLKFIIDVTDDSLYEVYLTGGQKNERRKWIYFLDDTELVVDVINLSGYCELLWEDNRNNRLREDIGLFRGIVNLDKFQDSHWIVILNKFDCFQKYIREGQSMKEHFSDFAGDERNEHEVLEYILTRLLDQIRWEKNKKKSRIPYIHFFVTNALKTDCVRNLFDYVDQNIVGKD